MHEQTVFVLEARKRWTPELERQFADEEIRVRGVRSAADIGVDRSERPVIVVDLASAPKESLALLARLSESSGHGPVLAVGATAQTDSDMEWAVRELGAVAYLPRTVSGEELAALCRRQWTYERRVPNKLRHNTRHRS